MSWPENAESMPLALSLVPVARTEDGGDGKPYIQWALMATVADESEPLAQTWAKADESLSEVLAGLRRSLSGVFGGLV